MQHEWKVERARRGTIDVDLVCLNCGLTQTDENSESECEPSQSKAIVEEADKQ